MQAAKKEVTGASAPVRFVLDFGDDIGAGIERPPVQRLRVPIDLLAPGIYPQAKPGAELETGGVAIAASFVDGRFVPPVDRASTTAISVGITAPGYQERVRQRMDPDHGGTPSRKKGPKLPSGLHELLAAPGVVVYETLYIGEDPTIGFVSAKCFGFPERGPRNCRVTTALTNYLTLSIGTSEPQLPGWREHMLAARALVLPMIDEYRQ